jgi:hypothetical protein
MPRSPARSKPAINDWERVSVSSHSKSPREFQSSPDDCCGNCATDTLRRPTASNALFSALELACRGFSCFPCNADKRPACAHGFKEATTDPIALQRLWAVSPGVLVGVATGPASGIAVVDVDAKHPEAHAWWLDNRGQLMPTRVHRTTSGGLHLVYRDLDGLRCSTSRIAKGVDVRAAGGYVCWWPAAGCPVLSNHPCTPWPSFLAYLAQDQDAAPTAPVRAGTPRRPVTADEIEARIFGLLKYVHGAAEGERNARLFWGACKIRNMVAHREISDEVGNQAFEELRQIGIHIGLPNWEVVRTIQSAVSVRNVAGASGRSVA